MSSPVPLIEKLAPLAANYDAIMSDVWGVIHNGIQATPAACDALIAYRTNPHLDQKDRGSDAARLMARTLRGEVRPVCAAAFPPLAANIERQATAEPHWQPTW